MQNMPRGQFICDSLVQSKLLLWVPSSVFQNVDHYQMLIIYLSQGNFHEAFKSSFLLKVKPNLTPNWPQYYQDRLENLQCSSCWYPLTRNKAFVTKCGHFLL